MALQTVWYHTDIPDNLITILENYLRNKNLDNALNDSLLFNDKLDHEIRNSKNTWIPSSNWISGFLWYYIERANRENFLYDISHIDGESIQYTSYGVGEYYTWHEDAGLSICNKPVAATTIESSAQNFIVENSEIIRKLSFSLQLSDVDDYEGGQLQFLGDEKTTYFAPKRKGTLIIFDSRTKHRVLKVTKGVRKSLVGWVVGPRWR